MRFKEISSIFLHFGDAGVPADASRKGWDSNIGTSILPRRKVKKMPKELEAQANEPKTQVANILKCTAISATLLERKIRCQNSHNLSGRGIITSCSQGSKPFLEIKATVAEAMEATGVEIGEEGEIGTKMVIIGMMIMTSLNTSLAPDMKNLRRFLGIFILFKRSQYIRPLVIPLLRGWLTMNPLAPR